MARPPRSSEGVFTTRKLKALLESGLGGSIQSRAALAEAMCREGQPITVHGIDAWFKRFDSNYAIPRPSVDLRHRSYPIPRQRWPLLLDLFGLRLDDLDRDDASFRRWCFERRRQLRQSQEGPGRWPAMQLVTDRPSLAVLPFVNGTGGDELTLLADSMTEDLTALLTRIPGFFVIAHATSRVYRDADALPDSRRLGRDMGVRYLVEGSLRAHGDQLRVTVQLIDAETGKGLWSQRFEHDLSNPLVTQDELTTLICAQLEPQLRLDDIAYGARTGHVTAWRLWQQGWHWLFVDAPAPMPRRAMDCFQRALALEADYGLAHAGIAIGLCTGMIWGGQGPEQAQAARDHARRAHELLPEHPVALYAMGILSFTTANDLEQAVDYLQRAVVLEPSNAMYQSVFGYLLANLGRAEEGLERCRQALELSPRDAREPFLCYMLGNACLAAGQYEEAIEVMSRCRRFSEVDFVWIMLGFAYHQLGQSHRALACLRQIHAPRPYRFYRHAILECFWRGLPRTARENYLALLPQAGIGVELKRPA